jgi:cyclophilin family peptidyl-prolyl cis-trans isomerase
MNNLPVRRLAALAVVAVVAFAACGGGATAAPIVPSGGVPTTAPASQPTASQSTGSIPAGCPTNAPPAMAADATATVTLQTEKGNVVIAVKGSLAPNATGNFVALAECGYYDGTVFHRIMPGFVLQGGDGVYGRMPIADPTQMGQGGPGYTITDDPVTAKYSRGTVAMARTPQPNSQGSQFFIVLDDSARTSLEGGNYAIMGTVTSGMDVVDTIAAMPNSGGQEGRALQPVAITKATVVRP